MKDDLDKRISKLEDFKSELLITAGCLIVVLMFDDEIKLLFKSFLKFLGFN